MRVNASTVWGRSGKSRRHDGQLDGTGAATTGQKCEGHERGLGQRTSADGSDAVSDMSENFFWTPIVPRLPR